MAEPDEILLGIKEALECCDQAALDGWMFLAGLSQMEVENVEQWAKDQLATMDHDVQIYWNGECNCDGHLN